MMTMHAWRIASSRCSRKKVLLAVFFFPDASYIRNMQKWQIDARRTLQILESRWRSYHPLLLFINSGFKPCRIFLFAWKPARDIVKIARSITWSTQQYILSFILDLKNCLVGSIDKTHFAHFFNIMYYPRLIIIEWKIAVRNNLIIFWRNRKCKFIYVCDSGIIFLFYFLCYCNRCLYTYNISELKIKPATFII